MTENSFAIVYLQSRWDTLNDLDRAQAVKDIHQSGVSLRNLASFLHCSPQLLTHLLQAGQAPLEDRVLARLGELSTRTLVQRARATGIRPTALHREAVASERQSEAHQHSQAIIKWLDNNDVENADRVQVIEKTRLFLSVVEGTWQPPPNAKPAGMPADKAVHKGRPGQVHRAEMSISAGFARQLVLWVSAGIADNQGRQRALELVSEALTVHPGLVP